MDRESSESLLTEQEAARQLHLSQKTLEGWRTRGGGPKFVRLGTRAVRYRPADLNEFVERGLRTSTASEPCPERVHQRLSLR
jgi:predicted DNA-binding transcriptional regulator AlpA